MGFDVEMSARSPAIEEQIAGSPKANRASKAWSFIGSNGFLVCISLIGIVLRAVVYLHSRSFWTDEAQLALNIRSRAIGDLFGKLDYCQAAPPGFLVVEKYLATWFGESEIVLRFLPLAAGVCAVVIFAVLARQILASRAAALSVTLFALSEALIRYSTEFKQYSVDVFFALLIWLTALPSLSSGAQKGLRFNVAALLAVIAPWFSFASILVIPAILCTGSAAALKQKDRGSILKCLALWVLFGASVSLVYALSLSGVSCAPCKNALMDERAVPPHELTAIGWFANKVFDVMAFPGGFIPLSTGVAFLCLLIGFWQLRQKRPAETMALCLPIALAAGGAWLSIYPFFGRFLLFAVPVILILVAEGVLWLNSKINGKRTAWISLCIVLLLLWPRLDFVRWKADRTTFRETEVKGALEYIGKNRQPGDVIYVYYGAYFPAKYYCRTAGITEDELTIGIPGYWWNSELRDTLLKAWKKTAPGEAEPKVEIFASYSRGDFSPQWAAFESDIKRLAGKGRVWVLFSLTNWLGSDEEKIFLHFLDKHGHWVKTKRLSGASVFLYEFPKVLGKPKKAG